MECGLPDIQLVSERARGHRGIASLRLAPGQGRTVWRSGRSTKGES